MSEVSDAFRRIERPALVIATLTIGAGVLGAHGYLS
jgi:hypothetical protein